MTRIWTAGILSAVMMCLLWVVPSLASYYVGSEQCFACHEEHYNQWQATGHPWKLRTAEEARSAKLPLPPGYRWDDISYVIGGATKKARYIDLEGYIITTAKNGTEAKTQYNMENASWSFYHKGEKKPYKCGPCHMTGYSPEGNQDGRPGMIGTWAENGIGCEECHGPASDHIQTPKRANIRVDRSAKACGKCHQRGGIGPQPPAKGGFIRHHEQINELLASPHGKLKCIECHDPHRRAIQVKKGCGACHGKLAKAFEDDLHARAGRGCVDCHMPKVAKSAIALGSYTGDVRSHLVKINTAPDANMFMEITEKGKTSTVAKGFITLEYACLGCHGSRDKAWAAKHARDYHK